MKDLSEAAFWQAVYDTVRNVTLVDTNEGLIVKIGPNGGREEVRPDKNIKFGSTDDSRYFYLRSTEKNAARCAEELGHSCGKKINETGGAFLMPLYRGGPDWAGSIGEITWLFVAAIDRIDDLQYE